MADQPARAFSWRRPAWIAVSICLLLALAIGAAIVLRLTLATWIAGQTLDDTPFRNASYRITRIDHNQIVIEDLVLDHPFPVRIARVTITYDAIEALNGRLDTVIIDGLDAAVTPDALDALSGSSGDGGMPIAIGRLILLDSGIVLSLDGQTIDVDLAGELTNVKPPSGTFQIAASGPQFALRGPLDIALANNGVLAATWRIEDGRMETPDVELAGLAGDFLLERPSDPHAALAVNLSLSSDHLRLDGHELDHLHIELASLIGMPATLASMTAQAVIEVGTSGAPAHGRVAARLEQVDGEARLTLDADAELNDDLELDGGFDLALAAPGTFAARIVTALPSALEPDNTDALNLALTHVIDLSAQFRTAGIDVAGRLGATSVQGDIAISLNGDGATATLGAPMTIAGLVVDPAWLEELGLSPDIATLMALPSDITLESGAPWLVSRDRDGAGRIDGAATLGIVRADGSADIAFDGAVTILPDGSVASANLRNGEVTGDIQAIAGLDNLHVEGNGRAAYDGGMLETQASLNGKAGSIRFGTVRFSEVEASLPFDATLSGDMFEMKLSPVALLSATSGQVGDLRSGPVDMELPLRLAGMPTSLMIYMNDNGWLDLTGLSHPRFVVTEPVSLRIDQYSLPLLSLELTNSGDLIWDARLRFAPPAVAVTMLDENGGPAAHVSGTLPGGNIHVTRLIENYLTATIETQNGSLRWDEQRIEISGLRALATYNTGLSPWPQLRLDVAAIRDLSSPARIAPLAADLRVTPVWPDGEDVRLSLNIHAPDKRYALNVEASYEQAANQAVALVRLPPLVFVPGAYQPRDLSPAAADYAEDVSGSIEVSGDITWRDGIFASDLDVAVRDLSATAFGTRMERMNTLITFDNVLPPSTPPGQLVAIAGFDAGLPMRDALISLALEPDGILVLESAAMKFAGGEVTSDRASWRIGSDPEPLLLQVTGVDVGELFALADMDELTATGTLDGTIPVRFAEGDVIIENANLASREPGELHYLPDGVPSGLGSDEASLDLVLEALSNFHYERLEVDLDRAAGGETEVGLHIAGANPDLYDGYPIELNVSLTGALDQIVRDSLAGYRIPEAIRERLSGF